MNPMAGARLLGGLAVLGLVMWGVWLLLGMFRLPEPLPTVIMIIFFLIVLSFVWSWWGGEKPIAP